MCMGHPPLVRQAAPRRIQRAMFQASQDEDPEGVPKVSSGCRQGVVEERRCRRRSPWAAELEGRRGILSGAPSGWRRYASSSRRRWTRANSPRLVPDFYGLLSRVGEVHLV